MEIHCQINGVLQPCCRSLGSNKSMSSKSLSVSEQKHNQNGEQSLGQQVPYDMGTTRHRLVITH